MASILLLFILSKFQLDRSRPRDQVAEFWPPKLTFEAKSRSKLLLLYRHLASKVSIERIKRLAGNGTGNVQGCEGGAEGMGEDLERLEEK